MDYNFNEFMERFAEEIDGQFSEYDQTKSVIIVPLEENRFQAVLGVIKYNEKFKKTGIEFSSKVCPFSDDIDCKQLIIENAKTCYAKFVIIDDFIKVEGSTFLETIMEEGLKEIIKEYSKFWGEEKATNYMNYLQAAVTMRQCLGRMLRSENDVGAWIILDNRVNNMNIFPRSIECKNTDRMLERLIFFFSQYKMLGE